MTLSELEKDAYFAPVDFPHRALRKLNDMSDHASAVLTEKLKLLCLRSDIEVVVLSEEESATRLRELC